MSAYVVPPSARRRAPRRRRRSATRRAGRGSRARTRTAMNTVSAASGRLMRKIQPPVGVLAPDRRRGTARSRPAMLVSPDQAPIAGARSSCAKAPWIIARLPGVSSAPPTPWRIRAAISTSGLGARPHSRRGRGEPDDADHEDPAPAEPVAQRAAEQDQAGQREQVAVGDPLQLRPGSRRGPRRWS